MGSFIPSYFRLYRNFVRDELRLTWHGKAMTEDIEIKEIKRFLQTLIPFDSLSPSALSKAATGLSIKYFSSQTKHVEIDYNNPNLYIVRTGAFEIRNKRQELIDRLGEGDYFGFQSLLTGQSVDNQVPILQDGLVYLIDQQLFSQLCSDSVDFERFFNRAHAKRLTHTAATVDEQAPVSLTIKHLVHHSVISMTPDKSVEQAALLMSEHRISSLLIIDDEALTGVLTDRDLRSRVLAQGLDGNATIGSVMTKSPICIDINALAFEASLLMSTHNIHHLPVLNDGKVIGMITTTDIIRSQNNQPIFLIGEIARVKDVDGLVAVSKKIPELLQSMIASDARAEEIGRVLTLVSDSLTRRLLILGEEKFGNAPIPYSWIVFGSQGRMDQTAGSDQDNGMILQREPNEDEARYFKALSQYVCSALDACGYIYCPGNIMAQTDKWRVDLSSWKGYFDKWVNTPSPQALLNASIFFDMRLLTGDKNLFDELQHFVNGATKGNQIFIASMAGLAVSSTPPLGFFGKFVLERDGEENKVLDLKHRGVALINDIVRVYALHEGLSQANTQHRLNQLLGRKILSKSDVKSLKDALEFIADLRLKNQGEQYLANKPATNYLKPKTVSRLLQHQLKEAFEVVHSAQKGLQSKFTRGMF